jgi:peptide/nickel transport system substrate-binding protein
MKRSTSFAEVAFLLAIVLAFAMSGCSDSVHKTVKFHCIGGWSMPPSFHGNPYTAGGDGTHMHFIWDKLYFMVPATGELIPRLAVSHHFNDDRTTLRVKLRQGVKWHDGTLFSSKDVKTTFILRWAMGWGGPLKEIETPSDDEIVFHWRRPFSIIDEKTVFNERIMASYHLFGHHLEKLCPMLVQAQLLPLDMTSPTAIERLLATAIAGKKSEVFQDLSNFRPVAPTGTGAFKFNFVSASDLGLIKFTDYWDAEKVTVEEVRILKSVSNDITWAYLISDEIDAAHPATSQDVTEQIMKLNPKIKLILPSDYGEFGFILNHRRPPLSDMKFRQALAHGINRELLRKISYYYAETGVDYHTGVLESLRGDGGLLDRSFNDKLIRYDFDTQKARRILDQAGYKKDSYGFWTLPDGTPFAFEIAVISGYSDWMLGSESLSNQLSQLGIRSRIRAFEPSLYHQQVSTGNFDIAANFGTDYRSFAHPSPSFDRYFSLNGYIRTATGMGDSFISFDNREHRFDALLQIVGLSSSLAEVREAVKHLAWASNEYLPFLTMYEKKLMVFVVDGVRVAGWPAKDDPIWSGSASGLESVYSYLISTGIVGKVGASEKIPDANVK